MFYPLIHLYQNKSLSLQYHLRQTLAAVKLQQLLENGIFVFYNVINSVSTETVTRGLPSLGNNQSELVRNLHHFFGSGSGSGPRPTGFVLRTPAQNKNRKWKRFLVEYLLVPLSSHLKNRSLQSLSVHWKYLLPTCGPSLVSFLSTTGELFEQTSSQL